MSMVQEAFINAVPVELLSDIFTYAAECRPSQRRTPHYQYTLSRGCSPFNLIAVCGLWRSLALNIPTLWGAISPVRNTIPHVEGWLSLIPAHCYDLHISEGRDKSKFDHQHASTSFLIASREYRKWRSLSIRLDPHLATEFSDFLQRVDPATLQLTRLDLHVYPSVLSKEQLSRIVGSIPAFPSLERVRINYRSRVKVSMEELPWSRLKTIVMSHDFSFSQHVHHLSKCTMAQYIELEAGGIDSDGVPLPLATHFDTPFSLSNLTSLILARGTDPLNLLSYFNLPNIGRLILEVGHRNHSSFERFIKMTPSLRFLVVELESDVHPRTLEGDLVEWLSATYLRSVPCFQLGFRDAHKTGLTMLEKIRASKMQLPPLACWKVDLELQICSFVSPSVVGWGQTTERVYWTYQDGRFELTEFYHNPKKPQALKARQI